MLVISCACVCVNIIAFDLKFMSVCGRHKNKYVIPSILDEHRLRADQLGLTLYSLCAGFNNKKKKNMCKSNKYGRGRLRESKILTITASCCYFTLLTSAP